MLLNILKHILVLVVQSREGRKKLELHSIEVMLCYTTIF